MVRNGNEIKKLSNTKFNIENPIWYEMVLKKQISNKKYKLFYTENPQALVSINGELFLLLNSKRGEEFPIDRNKCLCENPIWYEIVK